MSKDIERLNKTYLPGNTVFGKYQIVKLLGQGGMGFVYEVLDLNLNKRMALKILTSQVTHPHTAVRFQNEARNASRVVHSAITQINDFGVSEDGHAYMALELVSGDTLSEFVRKNRCLQLSEFVSVFNDVCGALGAAHKAGVVHRDLKPDNLIVFFDEQKHLRAKVLDFGVSRRIDLTEEEIQRLTSSGQIVGTPLYMSPEQARGNPVDFRSDYYSLGCVMFFSLVGVPPFRGDTALETIGMHREKAPPRLTVTARGVEIPESVGQLVYLLMAKDREERPGSVLEIDKVLNAVDTSHKPAIKSKPPIEAASVADGASYKKVTVKFHRGFILKVASVIMLTLITIWGTTVQVFRTPKIEWQPPSSVATSTETGEVIPGDIRRERLALLKKDVQEVKFAQTGLDDADLENAKNCTRACSLTFTGNPGVTEKGIANYRKSQSVFQILAGETGIKSLSFVPLFKNLRRLFVSNTAIDDDDLKVFENRPIEELDLRDTNVTEAGIQYLKDQHFKDHSVTVSVRDNKHKLGLAGGRLVYLARHGNRIVDTTELVKQLMNQADDERKQKRMAEADRDLAMAIDLTADELSGEKANRTYLRAQFANSLGDSKKARAYFKECLRLYRIQSGNRDYRLKALQMLIGMSMNEKDFSALNAFEKELLSIVNIKNRKEAAFLYDTEIKIGTFNQMNNRNSESLRSLAEAEKCLASFDEPGSNVKRASLDGMIAFVLYKIGRVDEALDKYLSTVQVLKDDPKDDRTPQQLSEQRMIYVNACMGAAQLLMLKHNTHKAIALNKEAIRFNDTVYHNKERGFQLEIQRKSFEKVHQ